MASIISAGTTSGTALNMTADTSGQLQLATNSGTTAVTIDTSQNVGIGLAPYGVRFLVYQNQNGLTYCDINNPNTGASAGAITRLISSNVAGSGTVSTDLVKYKSGAFIINNNETDAAAYTGFGVGGSERMRIDSSGNLLVGTTSPTINNSNSYVVLPSNGGAGGVTVTNHASGSVSGSVYAFYGYNGSSIGGVTQNGTTGVSYVTSSDYRLKENIAPMTGALDKVALLKPVTYKWKVDGSDGQGFIAHELQAVIPDCVTGEKDAVDAEGNPQYQGIDTSFLVATLTAAIQELTARVIALESK